MNTFSPEVVSAVLHHMNDDHIDDNLLIIRAFVEPDATRATMIGLNSTGGTWHYWTVASEDPLTADVPWPSGPISERPEIRREVVVLYEQACDRLGLEQRPH